MASVPFQILSDLHLETHPSYDHFKLRQSAPYLALLGDIGHVGDDCFFTFLERQVKRYWAVFFLLGNHEPHRLTLSAAKARVRAFAERIERLRAQSTIGKFIFLDQTRYDLTERVTILGCTLFSHVTPEQAGAVASRLVDFKDTLNWSVHDHNLSHQSDLSWLNAQVSKIACEEPQRNIAIFTHHSPCRDERAIDPRHCGSEVSSGFVTDLRNEECWRNPMVKMWAFGHTHYNCEFEEAGKKVLANQKGYYMMPQKTFNLEMVHSIGG
jgi:hypothetical protein